jgi:hypothetical protein
VAHLLVKGTINVRRAADEGERPSSVGDDGIEAQYEYHHHLDETPNELIVRVFGTPMHDPDDQRSTLEPLLYMLRNLFPEKFVPETEEE